MGQYIPGTYGCAQIGDEALHSCAPKGPIYRHKYWLVEAEYQGVYFVLSMDVAFRRRMVICIDAFCVDHGILVPNSAGGVIEGPFSIDG